MECIPCGKTFTGRVCYEQHMESAKHQKKVSSFSFQNGKTGTSLTLDDKIIALDPKHKINRCDVCDISFNSPERFQTHSLTLEHAEKILENMKHGINYNAVSSSDLLTNEEIDDLKVDKSAGNMILPELEENKNPHPLIYARCNACNKTFSGLEPYKQHLESAVHIKKIQLQESAHAYPTTFTCSPCKKVFTGHVPYVQHMSSDVHKKKLQHLDFLKTCMMSEVDSSSKMQVEEDHLKTDSSNPWFCNICNVQCSGFAPHQQHLSGAAHLKNKNKLQLQTFVSLPENSVQQVTNDNSCGNKLQLISQNREMDCILPGLETGLDVMSTDKLRESIKIFLPDENLDFDKLASNTHIDSENENVTANASEEMEVKQANGIESSPKDYQVCHICNVELFNTIEIANHYESVEHFNKRWPSSFNTAE